MKQWGSEEGNSVYLEQCPACGYKYLFDTVTQKAKEGDTDFIDVDLTATYSHGKGWSYALHTLNVRMCPKCGILIGEI